MTVYEKVKNLIDKVFDSTNNVIKTSSSVDDTIVANQLQVDVISTANSDAENLSLSKIGNKAITGTSAVTPATGYKFVMIQVIEDMVVSAQTDTSGALNADLTAFTTIPAGTVIYGTWDSIQLSSGEAIGHYEAE